jgi:predicted amidophosphoribosyltransferase
MKEKKIDYKCPGCHTTFKLMPPKCPACGKTLHSAGFNRGLIGLIERFNRGGLIGRFNREV